MNPKWKRQRRGSKAAAAKRAAKRAYKRISSRPSASLRAAIPQISIKRTCYLGNLSPQTTTTNGFWQYRTVSLNIGFVDAVGNSMGGLTNVAEYEALFDQFKLSAFKIVLRPRVFDLSAQQDIPASSSWRDRPYVSVIKDPYDRTNPSGTYTQANLNTFLTLGNVKTYRGDKNITIYMKPKVSEDYGLGAQRYVNPNWTDLNTAGKDMQHRGFHMFFHTQSMQQSFSNYDVFITYYLKFRGMK